MLSLKEPAKIALLALGLAAISTLGCGRKDSADVTRLADQGRAAFEKGDYPDAVDLLEQAVREADHEESYFWLGRAYYELGNDEQARRHFEKAADLVPQRASNRYWLGRALFGLSRYSDAQQAFEKATSLDATHALAHSWLGQTYLTQAEDGRAGSRDLLEKAVPPLTRAVDIDPTDAAAHRRLAHAYRQLGKREEARTELEAALRSDESNWEIQFEMGELLSERGDDQEAADRYVRALALHPDPTRAAPVYFALGTASARLGFDDEAIRALTTAVDQDPRLLTDSLYWLGRAYFGKGDWTLSTGLLAQHVEQKPDSVEAIYWLGRSHYRRLDYPEASRWLKEAAAKAPNVADYHYWFGRGLFWEARYAEAAQELRRSAELDPDHAESYLWLARAQLAGGDLEGAARSAYSLWTEAANERAEAVLRELRGFAPASETINRFLGAILFDRGMFKEAVGYLTTASKDFFADPMTFAYLGWSHLALGEWDPADAAFQRALTLDPQHPFALEGRTWVRFSRGAFQDALKEFETLFASGGFAGAALRGPREEMRRSRLNTGMFWALMKAGDVNKANAMGKPLSAVGVAGIWMGGIRVVYVVKGSPVDRAGIRPGDMINDLDLSETLPGRRVLVSIDRAGQKDLRVLNLSLQ